MPFQLKETSPSNEQWKTDGNCPLCRRQKYCHTECRAHKMSFMAQVRKAIADSKAGKAAQAIIEYSEQVITEEEAYEK